MFAASSIIRAESRGKPHRESVDILSCMYDAHNAGAYEFCGKLIHACAPYVTVHCVIQLRESNCGRSECE